ncbi:MAG: methylenetetrahydrofolate--tRNA-(uracil(54)-C(5))-methyltransferase (FADH(2)-oxidizing) TrmFO [Deltaproteobacteria bacterium]|nr:methylenetetrahydrofolate--tRNA-(uracil(54)-C(5))-methyltransferase (FADH(2)-oxidizing) TrmFO [Deltaproteobacteria bacterium]
MGNVTIIGAGLAGSEAAWQLASRGVTVTVIEMRPNTMTKAHKTGKCAELVCSNSFRGADLHNAVGLLKEELRLAGSLVMEAALHARVPAGGALAVDREVFSAYIDEKLRRHPLVTFREEEVASIPDSSTESPLIIATGPLTGRALATELQQLVGSSNLSFFDAISPIITSDSIDYSQLFRLSRYEKGGGDDYWNIPLDREQYYAFVDAVRTGEKYGGHQEVESDSIENLRPFEGCMPIEEMVDRGPDTLLFGPMKPVGLIDPRTKTTPYAVVQLRQDNTEATLWSMVGFQTRLKQPEQLRIFRALPGLAEAEFVRLGTVHRNTFIDSPKCMEPTLEFRGRPGLFLAGQVTGVEGYVESTAGGIVAGINAARRVQGQDPVVFPRETAIGSLMAYISEPTRKDFQPMNISFGLMPSYFEQKVGKMRGKGAYKHARREACAQLAIRSLEAFIAPLHASR